MNATCRQPFSQAFEKPVESHFSSTDLPPINVSLLQAEFLKPKYWLLWLGIGVMYLVVHLPLRGRWAVGGLLGRLGYHLAAKRRHVVEINLSLCFPELSDDERTALCRDNFRSTGISIIETATVWFRDPKQFDSLVDIEGLDVLQGAAAEGNGVMLLGMHLSTLDFAGAVLGLVAPFDVMYRRNKNKLLEAVMTRGRQRNFPAAIERRNVRDVIKALRAGHIVWYGPDQDYGRKHSIFAPFFGVEAATITATSRITSMTGADIVVFSHYRDLDTGRYRINLRKLDETYPSGDAETDASIINRVVEAAVKEAPEQYWWLHRRFKTRPEGVPRPY